MNVRADFPVFRSLPDLVYLDTAATSQKPESVIRAMQQYLEEENGSPHRGAHRLSVASTLRYDRARERVRRFLNARDRSEVIFTRNATESLNLLAYGFGLRHVGRGSRIVLSVSNHHSNILPWQMVAREKGAELVYMYVNDEGEIPAEELEKIDDLTVLVALPVISNGIGTLQDIPAVRARCRAMGAVLVLDAAQAAGHVPLDVQAMDADFLVFSGHKLYGPQGIGILYGKKTLLEQVSPFLRGGDMIEYVEEQSATFAPLPERLEAGTQDVAAAVGLEAALDYLENMGAHAVREWEHNLTARAMGLLTRQPGIIVHGPAPGKLRGALVTFTVEGVHPHDVASILDSQGVAIRAGHHCCQPLMKAMGTHATCRASFGVYSSPEDVDALAAGLRKVQEVFRHGT